MIESGNIKWHSAVIFGLKRYFYDIYNVRQAVDDNDEPIEGVIYISYDDPSFLFGGRKEKAIPDPLYGIPPSVEEIEASRKGMAVEELKKLKKKRKKEIEEQQTRWAKRALVGIMVAGFVDKIFDNSGVQEAIKDAMKATKEATGVVKKLGARLIASISTKIKNLANQFQKTGAVSSKELSEETQVIQQTVNQGLEGIKKAAKLGAEIKAGTQWKVDKAIGSVLDKLTDQEGTVLWEFEKEIKKAANLNDWKLTNALIGERNLVLVRTYTIIRKIIGAGKEIAIEQVKELAKQNILEGLEGKEAIERILKAWSRGSL